MPPISYRNMVLADIPYILKLEAECFPSIPDDRYWKPEMLQAHIEKFPAGQFVAEVAGDIVGSATSLRVPLEGALRHHTWRSISGNGYLTTHDPKGDILYGTEVMVHPKARRRGIARGLYRLRKDLVRKENLRAFVAGGRIPNYEKFAPIMTAPAYVRRVVEGKMIDRTLTAQLKSGMTVAGVMANYITDPNSLGWATILVWWNLEFEPRGAHDQKKHEAPRV